MRKNRTERGTSNNTVYIDVISLKMLKTTKVLELKKIKIPRCPSRNLFHSYQTITLISKEIRPARTITIAMDCKKLVDETRLRNLYIYKCTKLYK